MQSPQLENGRKTALLIFRILGSPAYVTILEQRPDQSWRLINTYPLDTYGLATTITFPALIRPDEHQIMISHRPLGHGSNYWHYDTLVVRIYEGRPEIVFDEVEELHFDFPEGRSSAAQQESAHFYVIPGDDDSQSRSEILEEQVIQQHTQTVRRWRLFSWDSVDGRFWPQPLSKEDAFGLLKVNKLTYKRVRIK